MQVLIVGGSDAGITAALRARQLDPTADVQLVVADDYPNFSICGIPYHLSGEVADWHSLAHHTIPELQAAGLRLHLGEHAIAIDPNTQTVTTRRHDSTQRSIPYDRLIIATGALPHRPPIAGLDTVGPADGVHLLHTMDDTFAVMRTIDRGASSAVIVGAGYIRLEMAEALRSRGLNVTIVEQLAQVLPRTLDPDLANLIENELKTHDIAVTCNTLITRIDRDADPLTVTTGDGEALTADLVLVVTGVRPDTGLAVNAGAAAGYGGTIAVDTAMHTNLPNVYAAGDCVHTHHRLLNAPTYLPLGTTAHKQGRVAGENAAGGTATYAGSLGTQVVRTFGLVAAATGLREREATQAGYHPATTAATPYDHKVYYPGATRISTRLTADRPTRRLLGAQLVGHLTAQIAKRIDILATAIHYRGTIDDIGELDLSYSPPLGMPYDAVQVAAHSWQETTSH